MGVAEGHIHELTFLGGGVFSVQLSDESCAKSLLVRSPVITGSRVILLTPWYSNFDLDDFDRRLEIPRFLATLSFLGLSMELRDMLPRLASQFGLTVPPSAVLTAGSLRI